jgi:diguanylate cyclase (GGDEF)-like protein
VIEAPLSDDEAQRMASLRSLGLLDTPPEERFDRITRMAQRILDVPIALVSLVDDDRQWFKSHQGLPASETPRAVSFCAHAITGDDVLHVANAPDDERFHDNPLVTGDPHIRFYAGAPIAAPDGAKLGTLCVIDREARELSDDDRRTLEDLAVMVEHEIAVTQLAISDELTGLSNRRGMTLLGGQVLDVCIRQRVPATLVFADLDRLKPINDEHGHDAGDRAIRRAADAFARTFRRADVIARLGGDEFAALLLGTDRADEAIARLRAAFEEQASSEEPSVGISVGTAVFDPAAPVTLEELIAAADAAMYAEKQAKPRPPR